MATKDIKNKTRLNHVPLAPAPVLFWSLVFFASGMSSPGLWFVVWLPPFFARLDFFTGLLLGCLVGLLLFVKVELLIRLCVAAFLLCRLMLLRACGRAPTPSAVGPRPRQRSGPDPAGGRAPTASPVGPDPVAGRAPTLPAVGPRPRRRSGHAPLGGRPFNGSNLLVVCSCRRVFAASFCLGPVTGPG